MTIGLARPATPGRVGLELPKVGHLGAEGRGELGARTTLGLQPERVGLVMVAGLETTIGLLLLGGHWLRVAQALLAIELVGILSPIALLPGEMFRAFPFEPTLAGQYVLKDNVLAAAGLVVAARALGARMVVGPSAAARM